VMQASPQSKVLRFLFPLGLIALLATSGCFRPNAEFTALRDHMAEATQSEVKPEVEIGLGRWIFGLAKKIVSASDDADAATAMAMLDQIERFQIGVYRLDTPYSYDAESPRSSTQKLVDHLEAQNYHTIVRHYDPEGPSMILVRSGPRDQESLREVVIVNFRNNEFNLIQLSGNVGEIVALAARDRGLHGIENAVESSVN
jgi:hypothetical protein